VADSRHAVSGADAGSGWNNVGGSLSRANCKPPAERGTGCRYLMTNNKCVIHTIGESRPMNVMTAGNFTLVLAK
jgi:hypothetical protein